MGRERGPRPGVTWQQQPATVEVVVPDDWAEGDQLPLSREQRRAVARARRRKGRQQ